MSDPFLAEVRVVGFNFAPRGYATCDGQLLPISQNSALFSLLGTTYGGDGRTTFALPDLRGRTPIHTSSSPSHALGQRAGAESVALSTTETPSHTHALQGSDDNASSPMPESRVFARATQNVYGPASSLTPLASSAVADAGSNTPHSNMQPYTVVNFIIALQGTFPSRN
jgi:microcystin-dependent protein